jgi:CRP/FNR family transcriptional regulator, nitrogen oxide reductase regulator
MPRRQVGPVCPSINEDDRRDALETDPTTCAPTRTVLAMREDFLALAQKADADWAFPRKWIGASFGARIGRGVLRMALQATPRSDDLWWNDREILTFLASVRPFRRIPLPALKQAARSFRVRRVERGEFVFREGQTVKALHLLAGGAVKVIRETSDGQEVILRLIRPGDIFGVVSTWIGQLYRSSALAMADGAVLELPKSDFVSLLETYPEFDLAILHELERRLRDADERISDLQTKQAACRVARAVLRVARSSSKRSPEPELVVSLSRQDLAELSGTNLSTASRTISDWERQGIVAAGRERVRILKPRVLASIAERAD